MFTFLALSELLRFHILLNYQGISTLEYLKQADKINRHSKVNVKIKNVETPNVEKKNVEIVQCGCFRLK